MAIPNTLRLPLVYASAEPAPGLVGRGALYGLIVGQCLDGEDELKMVTSAAQAAKVWGRGSVMHRMAIKALDNFGSGIWYGIGVADNSVGTARQATVTVTVDDSAAESAGTIRLWVGDEYVDAGVSIGDTPTDMASAIAALLPSASDIPFTASPALGVVTLLCRHKGTVGNGIAIQVDPDMELPDGVNVEVATTIDGATDPASHTALVAAMGDIQFDFIALGLPDFVSDVHDEIVDRWDYDRMLYGYVFTGAAGDAYADLYTEQAVTNPPTEKYLVRTAEEATCFTPPFELASGVCALAYQATDAFPGLNPKNAVIIGSKAAPKSDRFTGYERNNLLRAGYTTLHESGGRLAIDRVVGVMWCDDAGSPLSGSYDEAPNVWLAPLVVRRLAAKLTSLYGAGKKMIDDDNTYVPTNCFTPSMVHDSAVAEYEAMAREGWTQNVEAFDKALSITQSATVVGRLDGEIPLEFAKNLYVLALAMTWK